MNIGLVQSHIFNSLRANMTGQDIPYFNSKLAFRNLD